MGVGAGHSEGEEEEGVGKEEEQDAWKLEVPERWRDVVSKGEEPLPSERGMLEGWALVRG